MKSILINILQHHQTEEKSQLVSQGEIFEVHFGKGEVLHLEGENCEYFEIILSGQVAVESIDENGNLLTISSFSKGDILGANLVFSSMPIFPMTVTAKSETHLLRMTKTAVKALCMKDEKILDAVLSNLSNRSHYLSDTIKRLSRRSIREQLTDYFRQQYVLQGRNPIILSESKTALASRFGIARTSLSRELQKMKAENLIDFTSQTVTLLGFTLDKT